MLEARGERDLATEPRGAASACRCPENLECHEPAIALVTGAVDHGHSAGANFSFDRVAIADCGFEPRAIEAIVPQAGEAHRRRPVERALGSSSRSQAPASRSISLRSESSSPHASSI